MLRCYGACAAGRASRTSPSHHSSHPLLPPAAQGYKMRNEGYPSFHIPDHDGGIRTAVDVWCRDPAAAKARYGPIAFQARRRFNDNISRWNVANVRDIQDLFSGATSFNRVLSSWDVGQVERMGSAFCGATSFDRQLGGAWATSTADKTWMFRNSPGSIAGNTKDADGTVDRSSEWC